MHFRRHKLYPASEAEKAVYDARRNLDVVRARSPEVEKLAQEVRKTLARNHFAEQLQSIIFREEK